MKLLTLLLLCGCATRPAPLPIPAALSAPVQPRTITLAWDDANSAPVTFNLYSTVDFQTWTLLTNVPDQRVTVAVRAPNEWFWVTATNQWGESIRP